LRPVNPENQRLRVSAGELAAAEAAVPPSQVDGDRHDAAQMAALDSEKP
jgi:hypothetical protein